jgi:hypothetical protein
LGVLFDDHRLLAMEHLARFEADASSAEPLPERLSSARRATWATDFDVLTRQGDEAVHIARVEGVMPGANCGQFWSDHMFPRIA